MPAASPATERFWAKVEKTDACWFWRGGLERDGLPRFTPVHGHPTTAHRYSWTLHFGEIARSQRVVRSCGHKTCVRPDHLEIETTAHRSASVAPRFWANVRKTNSCWEWGATRNNKGYGVLSVSGVRTFAHRVSWSLHVGPIADGLCVLHRCDNPRCVRPDHLFLGTVLDNNRDMLAKGRHVSGFRVSPRNRLGHSMKAVGNG